MDCFVQFSGAERDALISRHHCHLDIDPPSIQVRDLGSINGTYVNGTEVDSGLNELSQQVGSVINHGDLLTVGGTTLSVDIVDCPHAGNVIEGNSVWAAGETAKKDCTLPC
jgi:pSer/pThr/pTyr-binding forkhead associated (FHA) protein